MPGRLLLVDEPGPLEGMRARRGDAIERVDENAEQQRAAGAAPCRGDRRAVVDGSRKRPPHGEDAAEQGESAEGGAGVLLGEAGASVDEPLAQLGRGLQDEDPEHQADVDEQFLLFHLQPFRSSEGTKRPW